MANPRIDEWLTPEGLTLLEGWARDGLTNEQIASNMGISEKTFYNWKNDNLQFLQSLKKGKAVADYEVENALFKRALGYSYEEKKYAAVDMDQEEYDEVIERELEVFHRLHPKASTEERDAFIESIPRTKRVLIEVKTKDVAPDTTAAIFWLKNRKPSEWRDKQEISHTGKMDHRLDVTGLTTEELRRLAQLDD